MKTNKIMCKFKKFFKVEKNNKKINKLSCNPFN